MPQLPPHRLRRPSGALADGRTVLRSKGMRFTIVVGVLLLSALHTSNARAAHFGPITIVLHDGGYVVAFDAVIDAPKNRVRSVLSDFAHLQRINPDITSSTFARAPSGTGERVRTVLHFCVWFFCKNLIQVEDVSEPDADTIVARIVPGAGDFSGGVSLWRLVGNGATTRLHYEATRELTGWLPPFVGPAVVKRTLRARFRASIIAVERLARRDP